MGGIAGDMGIRTRSTIVVISAGDCSSTKVVSSRNTIIVSCCSGGARGLVGSRALANRLNADCSIAGLTSALGCSIGGASNRVGNIFASRMNRTGICIRRCSNRVSAIAMGFISRAGGARVRSSFFIGGEGNRRCCAPSLPSVGGCGLILSSLPAGNTNGLSSTDGAIACGCAHMASSRSGAIYEIGTVCVSSSNGVLSAGAVANIRKRTCSLSRGACRRGSLMDIPRGTGKAFGSNRVGMIFDCSSGPSPLGRVLPFICINANLVVTLYTTSIVCSSGGHGGHVVTRLSVRRSWLGMIVSMY